MRRTPAILAVAAAALLRVALLSQEASAQDVIKVNVSRLAFPSFVPIMLDVVKDQGFDRKNGIDLEVLSYGAVAAYYGAAASGEVDIAGMGTHVLQKMRNEGVPVKAVFTYVKHAGMAVITADPTIRSFADLRGRSLAAPMGSSEYQLLAIYGRSKRLVLGKDITVVQADPPLARAQLEAKRVDGIMTWEPSATLTLRDNPQYRIILTGVDAWKEVAEPTGAAWQFLLAAREDFLRRQPQAIPRLLKVFQDGQRFIDTRTDEADRIVQRTLKLPEGVLGEAVRAGRMRYEMLPAWGSERPVIWNMFKLAVDWGYMDKMPDEGVIYVP